VNSLGRHDWVPMQGRFKRVQSCTACGMRKERMPGSRGGYTRFVEQNGSCHDEVTIAEPSCSGPPVDWALRGAN
jgi:hypothetical protein